MIGRVYGCLLLVSLLNSTMCQFNSDYHHGRRYPALSPQEQGLRPSNVLDELPPPDLYEPITSSLDPRLSDMNITALKQRLASSFDSSFMSIVNPIGGNNNNNRETTNVSQFQYKRNKNGRLIPKGIMPEFLSKMNLKYLTLADGNKIKTKMSLKLKRKIKQFLWAYTSCSVIYKWKDLGIRFWPRYLKEGHCPVELSCSIPPGMTCRPSASTHKTLLRFHCKNYNSQSHHRHCQWIKVEYPVLTQCSCSCSNNNLN